MALLELSQPEVPRDRWTRPVIDDVAHTRTSTLSGFLEDKSGLINWKAQRVAEGLQTRPELLRENLTLRDLADEAARAGGAESGADAGTAIHEVVESVLKTGMVPLDASDVTVADAMAVIEKIEALGLEPLLSEVFCIHPGRVVAGTADLVLKGSTGVFIGDVKSTGSSVGTAVRYSSMSWAVQMRCYAESMPWDDEGRAVPWESIVGEAPSLERGIVFHVQRGTGKATAVEVDLEAAGPLLDLAMDVRGARSGTYGRAIHQ